MRCPYGEEVGNPPSIVRCRRGFPGCGCADDWVADNCRAPDERLPDDEASEVMAWWREHDAL